MSSLSLRGKGSVSVGVLALGWDGGNQVVPHIKKLTKEDGNAEHKLGLLFSTVLRLINFQDPLRSPVY